MNGLYLATLDEPQARANAGYASLLVIKGVFGELRTLNLLMPIGCDTFQDGTLAVSWHVS